MKEDDKKIPLNSENRQVEVFNTFTLHKLKYYKFLKRLSNHFISLELFKLVVQRDHKCKSCRKYQINRKMLNTT